MLLCGWPLSSFLLSNLISGMRKASRERLTDNRCRGQLFYSNNKLRLCGKSNTVGFYRCEILVHHPHCSHTLCSAAGKSQWDKRAEVQRQGGDGVDWGGRRGGGGAKGIKRARPKGTGWFSVPVNGHLSCRVVVRQQGLSSETHWGEVGDHVWGLPSCYCP